MKEDLLKSITLEDEEYIEPVQITNKRRVLFSKFNEIAERISLHNCIMQNPIHYLTELDVKEWVGNINKAVEDLINIRKEILKFLLENKIVIQDEL